MRLPSLALGFAAAIVLGGCVLHPKENLRLEEARQAHARVLSQAEVAYLAPAEVGLANEALEKAAAAWETLQDPALVDHLAYLAKQRAAIAYETARRRAAEATLSTAYRRASGAPR